MLNANFHPFKTINNKLVKLEDVFLQANGMAGHKWVVKDLASKNITEINMHFQKDKKGIYHQHIDGDIKSIPLNILKVLQQKHIDYSFHDPHRNQASH